MADLAAKVKGLREAKGLSRTQLADRIRMERSYLWQIEHQRTTNLGRRILQGLAQALDVGIDYLTDDSVKENRSWEKVAADESLKLFLKKNDLSEKERDGLQRVSFTQSASRSLKGWEELFEAFRAYSQPNRSGKQSKSRSRSHKNVYLGNS